MTSGAAVLAVLIAIAPASVADPTAKPTGAPPDGLAKDVIETLATSGFEVAFGASSEIELWMRRDPPARPEPSTKLGVAFPTLEEGALVGAVRFAVPWTDYKGSRVGPGLYTLRYAVHPTDGNHMGVSIHRDFLLLIPAGSDRGAKPLAYADLVAASTGATGTKHPAVMSLFPLPEGAIAGSLVRNELEQWMLAVRAGSFALGIVVRGEGEH